MSEKQRFYVRIPGELSNEDLRALQRAGFQDAGISGSLPGHWAESGSAPSLEEGEYSRIAAITASSSDEATRRVAETLARQVRALPGGGFHTDGSRCERRVGAVRAQPLSDGRGGPAERAS